MFIFTFLLSGGVRVFTLQLALSAGWPAKAAKSQVTPLPASQPSAPLRIPFV